MKKDLGTRIIDAFLLVFCCLFFLPDKRKSFMNTHGGACRFPYCYFGFYFFIIFCTLSLRKKMDGTHGLITPLSTVW